ncbi:MAG: DNA-3-methyladenine glycosylase [Planctomycetes bacterium]|nr:DNA-3-methyladenine glycosylase [Planctomycetota bacterium]
MAESTDRLPRSFYERPTLLVARELIGRLLVRVHQGRRLSGMIVEAEAYIGGGDSACHASRGRTRRNAVMFGAPGHAYVYFTYGIHWMLNVVTEREDFPAAVLIRALEPVEGVEAMRERRRGRQDRELTSGPAKLCAALSIDRALNGADVVEGEELFLESYRNFSPAQLERGVRVGIDYARPRDRKAPWRFWLRGSPWVSR